MNEIIKSDRHKLSTKDTVSNLNDMLFAQLNEIVALDVNDEKFEQKKNKIITFAEVADRIIKNNEFALKVKVWNAHQKFRIVDRQGTLLDE